MVLEDFSNIIERAGYSKEHFVILATDDAVTVKYKRSGIERSYKTGHDSTPGRDFEIELIQMGFFTSFSIDVKLYQLNDKRNQLPEDDEKLVFEVTELRGEGRLPNRSQSLRIVDMLIPD